MTFRHACAVDLWREGFDVFSISRQLGHARLDVTAEYLRSLGADDFLTPITHRKPPALSMEMHLARYELTNQIEMDFALAA